MNTIEIYKDRNDNYYVQAGDYKVRIADGTRHDGTTIGYFELVKKLTIPVVVGQRELLIAYEKFTNKEVYNDLEQPINKIIDEFIESNY